MKFQYDAEPTLRETIFQAMGFSSVCWTHIEKAGVFDTQMARECGTQTLDAVRSIVTFELARLLDSTGEARDWNDAIEQAILHLEVLA